MNWPVKKLGNLTFITTGKLDANASDLDGIYPFFTCAMKPLLINKFAFDCEAVLIAGNGDLNVKYYEGKFNAYQRTYVIQSKNKSELSVRFLFHFLDRYVLKLREMSIGGVIKYIKLPYLTDAEIPLPPLAEQQRIAELLDTADRIIKQRDSAIAKLDQLADSVFMEMFGDPFTNSKNFETVKVSDICKLVNGRAFKPTEWKDSGKPIIRIQNLNDETKPFNYTQEIFNEKFLIKNGDVLFSWSGTPGTSFGCFKWLREDGWLNQHIFKVILNEKLITTDFFIKQINLKIDELISQAHGGVGLQHVTKKMVDELPLLLPPMKLQLDFCKRVTEFEKLKRTYKNAFDKKNLLQSSLQHQSFAVN
jgi:type I restriction enzyme S subunit